MSTSSGRPAFSSVREKRLLIFAVTALVLGAVLRLSYPSDIEYKRHYLAMAFPLVSVWFARFLANDDRWGSKALAVVWTTQLLVSVLFLYYIHVNGGAPNRDYGVAYSALQSLD